MKALLGFGTMFAALALSCGSTSPPADAPAPAGPTHEPAPVASTEPAPSATPSAAPTAAASANPPPAPARAAPTLDGNILGKPFHPTAACVAGPGKDPGTAYIEIYDVKDLDVTKSCGFLPATPGARKIGVVIPWTEGKKVDLAKLKGGKEPEMFVMSSTDDPKKRDRKDVQKDFKPTGAIEVLKAPKNKGDVGRIKIEMTSGKDKLQGEIDVDVMAAAL